MLTSSCCVQIFRILGDCSHMASKIILITSIHRNRSAEGVSMITQILYTVVFCARYLDIFRETWIWNLMFKIIYIFIRDEFRVPRGK